MVFQHCDTADYDKTYDPDTDTVGVAERSIEADISPLTRERDQQEKLSFSCWRDDALKTRLVELHESGRPLVIVAGIEAHVCVLQTCLDLVTAGFGVFAVTDAMSSRQSSSSQLAFERMQSAGVQMVNAEMVVFELLEQAGSPAFKQLSALIR